MFVECQELSAGLQVPYLDSTIWGGEWVKWGEERRERGGGREEKERGGGREERERGGGRGEEEDGRRERGGGRGEEEGRTERGRVELRKGDIKEG